MKKCFVCGSQLDLEHVKCISNTHPSSKDVFRGISIKNIYPNDVGDKYNIALCRSCRDTHAKVDIPNHIPKAQHKMWLFGRLNNIIKLTTAERKQK
jgi:hypothetical protein